jgi:putative transposase
VGAHLTIFLWSGFWRSVKHEDVYLKGYANMGELMLGLTAYMTFYNEERTHQSLGYRTPNDVYKTGVGGGAVIVDKFGGASEEPSVPLRSTEGSSLATSETKAPSTTEAKTAAKEESNSETTATSKTGQRRAAVCGAESTA